MRFLSLALLAGAAVLGRAQKLSLEDDPKRENTYFDTKRVPPLLELTPANYNEEINQTKFLMIKHYSPYCPHCIDFAPTYQTLYEFYHTSKPHVESAEDETFMDFYSFRFGMINCVAYYDLCVEHEVKTYPMTVIYEDGAPRESIRGVKAMDILSTAIEDAIETYKPGTRPKYLDLPEPGDHETPKESKDAKGTDGKGSEEKEKEVGKEWKNPPTGDKLKEKAPKKFVNDPNPAGSSVELDPDSFQKLVTLTKDPWFIKFYAPWCPHCQALAPTWEQLGKSMKDKVHIGEVNCEAEKRLCKEAGVQSFPTMLFFSGGERVEYLGLRGLGDFTSYANKALDLAGGVPDVDAKEFAALEEQEDVIFTYFYDHATTTEDFEALEKLPLSLIGHGRIVKTNDKALVDRFKITTWPRLVVSRNGRPEHYPPLAPKDMRDVHQILEWMTSVWLPLVPEVTAVNARQIMDNRIVVLAVLDRENDKQGFENGMKELKAAAHEWADRAQQTFELDRQKLRDAKQAKIEEAKARGDERGEDKAKEIVINMEARKPKEVGFAWIDGVFWQRWLKTTYGVDVTAGSTVLINDQDRRRYWDTTPSSSAIPVTRTSILATLDHIAANGPSSLRAKYTISSFEKIFWDIRFSFVDRPYFTVFCVAGIVGAFVYWLRNRSSRRRRGGHFVRSLDDGLGVKEGFLGGNSGNHKAD